MKKVIDVNGIEQTSWEDVCSCGNTITRIVPRFSGRYCNKYCCGCCPDAKNSPCQNDKIDGTLVENLASYQIETTPGTI
jgi:hypothetical protein